MDTDHSSEDFGRSVKQTVQRFSGAKPQLPPYPPIKQKPKLNANVTNAGPTVNHHSASSIGSSMITANHHHGPPSPVCTSVSNKVPTSTSTDAAAPHHSATPQGQQVQAGATQSIHNQCKTIDLQTIDLTRAVRQQLEAKAHKQPFVFTLMVVGASGLGKSTFVNQLFECPLYDGKQHPAHPAPADPYGETIDIRVHPVQLSEQNVQLWLNLVDTPGFGDTLNGSGTCEQVLKFVEKQLDTYLKAETRLKSHRQTDQRVHCCLYFIQPGRHMPLKPLDIHVLKTLQHRVNLVPVIGKADTLTASELANTKSKVLEQLANEQIRVYDFPDCSFASGLNSDEVRMHEEFKARVPFAIVSSDQIECDQHGSRHRVRKYPWGKVEVDNLDHSDFIALKRLIINFHMLDMIERTNCVFYEAYRKSKLSSLTKLDDQPNNGFYQRTLNNTLMVFWNPLAQMEEERKDYESKMQVMKSEMELVFEAKVREKVKRLEDSKLELKKREEQMERQVAQMSEELEQQRKQFAKEQEAFEMVRREMEQLRSASMDSNGNHLSDVKEKKKEKKKSLF